MQKGSVLIVEDEAIIAKDIQYTLERLGYEFLSTVASGKNAIQQAKTLRPDFIIMDIVLKGEMDGIETAEHIRTEFDIPIIFLTAYADDERLTRAKMVEPFGYIIKPFDERELHTVVEMALYRHKMERKLRTSEARYRAIIEDQTELICRFASDYTLTFVNAAYCRYRGKNRSDLIGKNFLTYIFEEDRPTLKQHIATLGPDNPAQIFRHRAIMPDGEIRWQEWTNRAILDDQSQITEYQSVGRDITEQLRSEEALRQSEAIFRDTFESIPDPASIWERQTDGQIALTRLNKAARRIAGKRPGADFVNFFADDSQMFSNLQQAMETNQAVRTETYYATEHPESSKWFLVDFARIAKGKVIVIAKDITQQKRIEQAFAKRTRALQSLHAVALQIGAELEMPALLRSIIQHAMDLLNTENGAVGLYDETQQTIRFVEGIGLGEKYTGAQIILTDIEDYKVLEGGHSLIVDHYGSWKSYMKHFKGASDQAALIVPMLWQKQLLGILILSTEAEKRSFKSSDAWLAEMFAAKAAVAIERSRLFEAEREQHTMIEALRDTTVAISRTLDLNEVLDRILGNVGRVVPHDTASIMFIENDIARVVRCYGYDELSGQILDMRFPISQTPTLRRMARTRRPLVIDDTTTHPLWKNIPETAQVRAYLGAPICWEEQPIGFLTLDNNTPDTFTAKQAEHLQTFANQAAVAIQNARLYRELQTYSKNLERMVERRTAEIQRIKERIEVILNNSPDAILLLWTDGTIQMTNQAFCDLFGYQHTDEVFAQPVENLTTHEYIPSCRRTWQAAVEQGQAERISIEARRKDGSTFDADVAIAPIKENDQAIGLVCSVRDISAYKEMQRMKDAFIQNISHQFRTPVTTLHLYVQLLQKQPAKTEQYIEVLSKQVHRLIALIQDILDITALTNSQTPIATEAVALEAVVRKVQIEYEDKAKAANLTLSTQIAPDIRTALEGDFDRLTQALSELVENAIIFTPAGGRIVIALEAGQTDQEAVLWVHDTGPGISTQEKDKIFERFYRGELAESGHMPGTGLGLAVAKEIVSRHRGQLDVTSPGKLGGASFYIWLPTSHPKHEKK